MYGTGVHVYSEDEVGNVLRNAPGGHGTLSRYLWKGAHVTLWRSFLNNEERFHARLSLGDGGPFRDYSNADINAVLRWVNEQKPGNASDTE